MTRVVAVDLDRPDPSILDEAAAILRSGGLVAFGTETVYGLGADATDPDAVARIFAAKGRPATNPLIVHVADVAGARSCVADWPDSAQALAEEFWPGPLSLVLPRSGLIPDIVTAGQDTVGVRVPAPLVARELIRRAGRPIAAPSANPSNRISPTMASHVRASLDGKVDLILDSGPGAVGIESTVLSLAGPTPTILRLGRVTSEQIAATLRRPIAHLAGSVPADRVATSPGQLAVHYAPRTPAFRLDPADAGSFDPAPDRRWGGILLGLPFDWPPFERAESAFVLQDPADAESRLYAFLHRLDDCAYDFVVIALPTDPGPDWAAVLDRVTRATRPWGPGPAGS